MSSGRIDPIRRRAWSQEPVTAITPVVRRDPHDRDEDEEPRRPPRREPPKPPDDGRPHIDIRA